ncbi:MAG TPA: AgmX/PglI C-terminal domain-containing protein [Nannocystis sp.]
MLRGPRSLPPFLALVGLLAAGAACKKDGDARPPADTVAETAPAADESAAAEEEESPYLDFANFNKRVEEHLPEIVACYRDTVGSGPDAPTGRIKVTIVVAGDGSVKQMTRDDQRSTLKHDALYACMQSKVKAWKFNIVLTGADSPMPYTFDFSASGLLK